MVGRSRERGDTLRLTLGLGYSAVERRRAWSPESSGLLGFARRLVDRDPFEAAGHSVKSFSERSFPLPRLAESPALTLYLFPN